MGSDDGLKRKSNYEIQFSKGNPKKDDILGTYFEYSNNKNSSKIICIEKLLNSRQELLKNIEESKKKILNKNENMLNILDFSVEIQKNWCSTFYLLKLFYEYPKQSLKDEIKSRKNKNQNFNMKELTHLLYDIINAGVHLQENNIKHQDICPSLIYLSKTENYKLLRNEKNRNNPERYQLEKMLRNKNYYLSPKLYIALKKRYLDNIKHNYIKSDIFSFGLVLLEAGLLKSIKNIYDSSSINKNILDNYLKEFEEKYDNNPLLFSSLRKILEFDEDERPDFISLKEVIPEYDMIKEYFKKLENGELDDEDEEEEEEEVEEYYTDYNLQQNSQPKPKMEVKNLSNNNFNNNFFEDNSNQKKVQVKNNYNNNFHTKKVEVNTNIYSNNYAKPKQNKITTSDNYFFDAFDEKPKSSMTTKKTDAGLYAESRNTYNNTKNQSIDNFFDQNSFIPPQTKKSYSTNLYNNIPKKKSQPSKYNNNNYFNNKNAYFSKNRNYNNNVKNVNNGNNVNAQYYQKKFKPSYKYSVNSVNNRPMSMNTNNYSYGNGNNQRPISQKNYIYNSQKSNYNKRPESSFQKTNPNYTTQNTYPYQRY